MDSQEYIESGILEQYALGELSEAERAEWQKLPFNETKYRKELGAPKLFGESGYSTLERVWARPTFEVNGLLSGFTGDGAKTVLPATAMAKVSMPYQKLQVDLGQRRWKIMVYGCDVRLQFSGVNGSTRDILV